MATTGLSEVQDQIQKFWSPIFETKLKEDTILPSLVSKEYEGTIKEQHDTVYVSAINRPTAVRKNVNDADADTYSSQKLTTSRIAVQADTIIETGVEITSLAMIQSQLGAQDSKIRTALFEALEIELNNYIYEKVAPSAAAPDHVWNGVATYDGTALGNMRVAASKAFWQKAERYLLLDPTYYQNMLDNSTLTSADFAPDVPKVGGQFSLQRMGFNILEDNSAGMSAISPTAATDKLGLAFTPDFLLFVMQQGITFKLSDLHGQKKRGFFLSAEMLVGSEQGIEGDVKHQTVYAA